MSIRDKVSVMRIENNVMSSRQNRTEEGDEKGLKEAETESLINRSSAKPISSKYSFHSTQDIIDTCVAGELPNQIMINFHPQRWTNNPIKWTQEMIWQNLKNVVKAGIVKFNS